MASFALWPYVSHAENKEVDKAEQGFQTKPSGLLYKDLELGSGRVAADGNLVFVRCETRLPDGTVFGCLSKLLIHDQRHWCPHL